MIVVDASLVIDLMLATPSSEALSDRIIECGHALAAPEIVELEILQVLKRLECAGRIDQTRVGAAFATFDELRIERFSHAGLRDRIWSLRHNLTAYDAAYFALAELLEAPLWTRDAKFADVSGSTVVIEVA